MKNLATIINTPSQPVEDTSRSAVGLLMGIVLLLVIAAFLYYVGPSLARGLNLGGTTNVQIPDKVDVNVNTPNQ